MEVPTGIKVEQLLASNGTRFVHTSIDKIQIKDIAQKIVAKNSDSSVGSVTKRTGKVSKNGSRTIQEVISESSCTKEELFKYLSKNVDKNVADEYLKSGKWPEEIQIPKKSSVLNPDGSIDWSKAASGGYTLNPDGTAIKKDFVPKVGEVIDRYGNASGRYTSPVIDGKSYPYNERSLPYVEDLSNYHQYEVTGDFSKVKEYVDKCSDAKLKVQIDANVTKYYDGDYKKLISYKGEIAEVKGGGTGGGTQYEFPLPVEWLEKIGLLKEIK